jgi:hypothetical protein
MMMKLPAGQPVSFAESNFVLLPRYQVPSITVTSSYHFVTMRRLADPLPGKRGGLNGSTQHSVRTHLALKTKAKIAR